MSMDMFDAGADTRAAAFTGPSPVLELWRDLTMRTVWRYPDDWHHPAVDALVEALDTGIDPLPAARRLGAGRAQAGTGIDETIDDLACAYESIGTQAPVDVVRAVACGWVTAREAHPAHSPLIRPVSGLPTAGYLAIRLRETYGLAARAGVAAPDTHCLLIIDVALYPDDVVSQFKRASAMGVLLRTMFGEGHPSADLMDGLYAVLLERDSDLGTRIARIRQGVLSATAEIPSVSALRQPPSLWVQQLPQASDDCSLVLDDIRR